MDPRRVVVLGLDSVPPGFLFDRFRARMPHLGRLMERGRWGTLRTIDPPITVPAWAVMFTGVDPGTLGIYGFRHRRAGTYAEAYTPTPQMLPVAPIWEELSRAGRRSCVVGMPPGYPPPAIRGVYVGDFLTPDGAEDFVNPVALAPELRRAAGGPIRFDLLFRAEDRERIAGELFEMTRQRWALARHLWRRDRWDLFALHDIGPDRLHHAFWKYFDPAHPRHVDHPRFGRLADEYYALLDREIGAFLEAVPDDVALLIASDHGSQAMEGCFCINEWLRAKGYLTLEGPEPAPGTPLDRATVDWSRSRAWGAGGYYARLFFNVRGREPEGIVPPDEVPRLAAEIARGLAEVDRPAGGPLGVQVLDPREIYRELRGDAPDRMIYFGGLRWRSAGTVGHGRWFLEENDTGPDDSVHSLEGVYLIAADGVTGGHGPEESILDVAPTLQAILGVRPSHPMQGRPIAAWLGAHDR
jgi:predicted AlkP superfamily phosphohydrolase/phosphomutase